MANEKKSSQIIKTKKPYTPPQLTAYGSVEELTRGTSTGTTHTDAASNANTRPASKKAPTPAPKK